MSNTPHAANSAVAGRAPALVAIGGSLGGAAALRTVLADLPADFPLPIAVVLHGGSDAESLLVNSLRATTQLQVREVEDLEPLRAGTVYLAPADYHLLVETARFVLSTDAPVHFARPSLDVLFESAVAAGVSVVAVVLSGNSEDGAHGARLVADTGGTVLVQDPATATASTMPTAARAAVPGADVVPLDRIAARLLALAPPRPDAGNANREDTPSAR